MTPILIEPVGTAPADAPAEADEAGLAETEAAEVAGLAEAEAAALAGAALAAGLAALAPGLAGAGEVDTEAVPPQAARSIADRVTVASFFIGALSSSRGIGRMTEEDAVIREATAADAEGLLGLIDALADYEHLARPDAEARQRLVEHGFGGGERFFQALLLEIGGRPAGYAIYFFTYSTFLARPTLYLEDVFVLPEERQRGHGTALMRRLTRTALDAGCGRMEWQVLDWNEPSIRFYDGLGARRMEEWLPYRLTREEIERLLGEP
jgi:GNAT superfamily N-acetyltransferase